MVEHNLAAIKIRFPTLARKAILKSEFQKNAEIAQLVEHNLAARKIRFPTLARKVILKSEFKKCGNSSVGRAQPCRNKDKVSNLGKESNTKE